MTQVQGTVSHQTLFKDCSPLTQLLMRSGSDKGNSEMFQPAMERGKGIPLAWQPGDEWAQPQWGNRMSNATRTLNTDHRLLSSHRQSCTGCQPQLIVWWHIIHLAVILAQWGWGTLVMVQHTTASPRYWWTDTNETQTRKQTHGAKLPAESMLSSVWW